MKRNKQWNKSKSAGILAVCFLAFMAIGFSSCETDLDKGIYQTSSEQMIDEYMLESEDLNLFLELVEKADLKGMLHAYGTYTCFVPTNAAVQSYMDKKGLNIASLEREQAAEMVRFHVVNDTLATSDFTDSRLNSANMVNQYIMTKTTQDAEGKLIIEVNRNAKIVEANVRLGNGYVHVVDGFLSLPDEDINQGLELMADADFSIMKKIVKELAGEGITINQFFVEQDTAYISLLVQNNRAFERSNISDKATLLAALQENNTQGSTDAELLKDWLGYHCLPGRIYIKDILDASTLSSSVKNQPIVVTLENENIFLNRYESDDIYEEGIPLSRQGDYVDYVCSNGVIQMIEDQLQVVIRPPKAIYWDMADQPEIRALKGYKKGGTRAVFNKDELSRMVFDGTAPLTVSYMCDPMPEVNGSYDNKSQYIYNDFLQFRVCSERGMQWVEFKLPVLSAGKYKVWLCWRRMNPCKFRTTFIQEGEEDQISAGVVNLEDYMPTELDDDQMEAAGWKQYNAKQRISVFCCKNIAVIDVKTTGEHILRLDALITSKDVGNNWDMIQIIPIDEDQKWPRLDMRGEKVYQGTPSCKIFPDDGSACEEEEEVNED